MESKKGNPYKRANKWEFYYYIRDENGKRIQKRKGGFETKEEAAKELEICKAKVKLGMTISVARITVADFLEQWFSQHKRTLEPNSINGYYIDINHHIIPAIGNLKLANLKPSAIEEFYYDLMEEKNLSAKTVRYVHNVLKVALNTAVDDKLIAENPCIKVKLPKSKPYKATLLSVEQIQKLFEYLKNNRYEVEIKLACLHGLRRGEVLGLKFSDIDFEKHTMTINRQVTIIRTYDEQKEKETSYYGLKSLKTEKSNRVLEMSEETERLIRLKKIWCDGQKKRLEDMYENNDLICCNEDGTILSPQTLYHAFKRILKACDLPDMRFHDLRHSYATLCVDLNIPIKVISQALGHSSTAVTAEVYADSISAKKELAERISNAITSDKK